MEPVPAGCEQLSVLIEEEKTHDQSKKKNLPPGKVLALGRLPAAVDCNGGCHHPGS